jgi:subtilisin family serine protease
MTRRVRGLAAALGAAALVVPAAAHAAPVLGALGDAGPRLMVTFADRPDAGDANARLAGLGEVRPVVPEAGVWSVAPAAPDRARAAALGRAGVEHAEWSLARRSADLVRAGAEPPPPTPLVSPPAATDPLSTPAQQWGLYGPQGPFWRLALTGSAARPRIAILDGGIAVGHEEWRGSDSPLVAPRSTYADTADADDWGRTGHGTHVAGIAAAPANGVGILGVAPAAGGAAEVIPVQIADRDGRSTDETMMKGIRWAVRNGARVINISAGGPGYSQAFQDTVNWAYARGALIVSSVGNEGGEGNVLNYPAAYDHVIGVAAQCDGEVTAPDCPTAYGLARFSNHNRSVDLVAPGVNMLSSVPRRVSDRAVLPGYALKDGTSMSAPYVAGVAALVFGANPGASPYQVARQLLNTATDLGPGGRDDRTGHGLVNPEAAVTLTLPRDDVEEVNDDVPNVARAGALRAAELPARIEATVDRENDPRDLYPITLRAGQRIAATVTSPRGALALALWRPGTLTVGGRERRARPSDRVAASERRGARAQSIVHTARAPGRYYIEVAARAGAPGYLLTVRT